tara:strand:- start:346 stop:552 length:207 start_codon:yes stop_codon:yes gene_type:complete
MINMTNPATDFPMAQGPNMSRPMHSATTGDTSKFTIPVDMAQSGIPNLNPTMPTDKSINISNPYSQTT